ncbi:hypothetical protein [Vibrio parahaemolyticus]|uniref:hypothetical protein n=1 Tax=Vibrio parahaemolyticus TaxID=670 RepID=UPI0021530FB3|nr:hypothetical protein [Vibrio parahaemolyticus]
MNLSIWKTRRNQRQLVASQCNGTHIYFDSFELETSEASLWLFQGMTLVACIKAQNNSLTRLNVWRRLARKTTVSHWFKLRGRNHEDFK